MSGGYSVDVKTTHLTGSADVFAGPARVLGIYYCSEGALGTIVIRDGSVSATVLATFDVPIGSGTAGEPVVYQIDVPGNGIYCPTGAYAQLTGGVNKVTIFYG
jgi:hypothetical protein